MKRFIFLLTILIIFANASKAQLTLKFADSKYTSLNYPDAIPFYKYYVSKKKGSKNADAIRKLANCYRLTNQPEDAEIYYEKLVNMDTVGMDRIYFAEMLIRNNKYAQAEEYISSLPIRLQKDQRIIEMSNAMTNRKILLYSDTGNIRVNRLPFNSDESDFAPTIIENMIVFASSRQVNSFIQRNHSWTESNFISLFASSSEDGYLTTKPFAPELRNKYNYGPASFFPQDGSLYYTVNNPKKKDKNGYTNLRIQSAESDGESWYKTDKFPFNSLSYACAHPSVSKDGQQLYFSSNMPGGFGGMDIYVCNLIKGSEWSQPKNLGAKINSKGDELFPFIDIENQLFFASNGKGGLGGLDIFYRKLSDSNSAVVNPGAPINSSYDDFGIVFYPGKLRGFFSSDRGHKGIDDDIYSFERISKTIKIYVIDSISRKTIDTATVQVASPVYFKSFNLTNGKCSISISQTSTYQFLASAKEYTSKSFSKILNFNDSIVRIELVKIRNGCNVQGTITKKGTNEKLDSVLVKIIDFAGQTGIYTEYTTANGFFKSYGLKSKTMYEINVSKPGYFSKGISFQTTDAECKRKTSTDFDYIKDLELEPIVIGKAIKIDNIYFDLSKWNIRPDAAKELDKIVKLLNDNPEIVIELSSHTDSRGSSISNEVLSDKRAKSSAAYIVSKGISESRITGKGYGEYKLINRCSDGVKCSEKEHQQNRRTEFKVTGFVGQVN